MFLAIMWWGHGGEGAPSPLAGNIVMAVFSGLVPAELPFFVWSPVYGLTLASAVAIILQRRKVKVANRGV